MPQGFPLDRPLLAARCHEIQTALQKQDVPEFESIIEVGMAVRLALHLRGLPLVKYETAKLVAHHYLAIPPIAFRRIVQVLADVEFVRLQTTGQTIEGILPTVPYYEDLYEQLGEYAETSSQFNEAEQLALTLVNRLASAPENLDALRNSLGAENALFSRGIQIGEQGSYLIHRRARGRDILFSPTYFSENADIFVDSVAAHGASSITSLLAAVRQAQGWPLKLIEDHSAVGNLPISPEQIKLLKRLAQDGVVKPPSIQTSYAGQNYFIFTPTPTGGALSPTKRDVYERAMAIVAALRQGQLLPERYAIRSPKAVLWALRTNLRLGKATREATQQYSNLVHLRVGRLRDVGHGYSEFEIIDTEENREALAIADTLTTGETVRGIEIDDEARTALQREQQYIESLISQSKLRQRETIALPQPLLHEIELSLMGVIG